MGRWLSFYFTNGQPKLMLLEIVDPTINDDHTSGKYKKKNSCPDLEGLKDYDFSITTCYPLTEGDESPTRQLQVPEGSLQNIFISALWEPQFFCQRLMIPHLHWPKLHLQLSSVNTKLKFLLTKVFDGIRQKRRKCWRRQLSTEL